MCFKWKTMDDHWWSMCTWEGCPRLCHETFLALNGLITVGPPYHMIPQTSPLFAHARPPHVPVAAGAARTAPRCLMPPAPPVGSPGGRHACWWSWAWRWWWAAAPSPPGWPPTSSLPGLLVGVGGGEEGELTRKKEEAKIGDF
jgi:hypothetical protein